VYQTYDSSELWDNVRILLNLGNRAKDVAEVYKFLGVTPAKIYLRNSRQWHLKLKTGVSRGQRCFSCKKRKPNYRGGLCKECYNIKRRSPFGRPINERHWNWQGGKTKTAKFIRFLPHYKAWRRAIFIRDKFTCVICGANRVYIEADHFPVPFSAIVRKYEIDSLEKAIACKLLWDIKNGRTLCKLCHKKTPTYGEKAKKYIL